MTADVIVLTEVDAVQPGPAGVAYRYCSRCGMSRIVDYLAHMDGRDFWMQFGGENSGVVVCEYCLVESLSEKPQ